MNIYKKYSHFSPFSLLLITSPTYESSWSAISRPAETKLKVSKLSYLFKVSIHDSIFSIIGSSYRYIQSLLLVNAER